MDQNADAVRAELELTDDDHRALDTLEEKEELLQTFIKGLVEGYDTGLFLWGEGGVGKSYLADKTLKELKAEFVLHNSRLTARGFFDRLAANPSKIHWIEDAETLFADKNAAGIIRSACWSQSKERPSVRQVTWGVHVSDDAPPLSVNFTGAVLVISNVNLANSSAELRAVKTRVRVAHMDVSPAEIFARMKVICGEGYEFGHERLEPAECWEVASFIRDKMASLKRNLDLRLLRSSFHDYLLSKNHQSSHSWQELVESRMSEGFVYKGRAARTAEQAAFAKELKALNDAGKLTTPTMEQRWTEQTGKSRSSFYRMVNK